MKLENLRRAYKLYVELEEIGFTLRALEDCTGVDAELSVHTKDIPHYHSISLDGHKDKEFIQLFIDHLKAKQDRMKKELGDLL